MNAAKKDELTKVQRLVDGKCNYIDANGKIISDTWFEWIGDFYDEFALVGRENHEYNYMDKEGKIVSNEWFKWLDLFRGEFVRVQRFDGSMNFINKDGKIISDEWFRCVGYFDEYDLAVVHTSKLSKSPRMSANTESADSTRPSLISSIAWARCAYTASFASNSLI